MEEYQQDTEPDEFRYLLRDGMAEVLVEIAKGLTEGARKHPGATWTQIPTEEHLARAMRHIVKYGAGDRSENHLSHACMRVLMAYAVAMPINDRLYHVSEK